MTAEQILAEGLTLAAQAVGADDPRQLAQHNGCTSIHLVEKGIVIVQGLVEAHWTKEEWAEMQKSLEAGRFSVSSHILFMEV